MAGIWSLVVCLGIVFSAAPGSTQNSPRTLFLISSPELLHSGTPASLAVTVLTDSPVRLTAEVTPGNTKVSKDFQGDSTEVLTLPPIFGSTTPDAPLNLTVTGHRGDELVFRNTTSLAFGRRNVSVLIQTDRPRFHRGDTVRIRVVCLRLDNRPHKGPVHFSIQDPTGNAIDTWSSSGNLGIVLREFRLWPASAPGRWSITAVVNGLTDVKEFTVEEYERPRFEMLLKTSPRVLGGGNISGSVRVLYPSGQPGQGTLTVTVASATDNAASPVTQTKEIYGSTRFLFNKDQIQGLRPASGSSSDSHLLHVTASVTDSLTGFTVEETAEVHVMKKPYQLTFWDFPRTLKPSLYFSSTLRISTYDRKPLSPEERMFSAVIEVTQRTLLMNEEPTTLTLPVPEDGNVRINFLLQDQVMELFIRATFRSSEETLRLDNSDSSPSGSYIQISPIGTLPAQVGSPLKLDVDSTFAPTRLHFVVSSRGQVVAAGTQKHSSFSLTPALSWYPEACVTVYAIRSDGEVVSDEAHIPIKQHNHVSLNWSSDKAQPGELVSLAIAVHEPGSHVGIVVTGMRGEAPQADRDLPVQQGCNIRMLTNAMLHKKEKPDGPRSEGDSLMIEKYWRSWMDPAETLLWLDVNVSEETWTSEKIRVPDGFSSLGAAALVMSDNLGLGFTPVPQELSVSKDFSLSLHVPPQLIRREEIVLEVNVINHLEHDIEVILLIAQSDAFEFVLADTGDFSVVNAQRITLGSHASASALFPIRPVALGVMEISVDGVSADASDSLVRNVLVKSEGVEQFFSDTVFLEPSPSERNGSRSVSFSYPADVVPGSQTAHMALVGDILALSISNLKKLVQVPLGCGEQNMIRVAPSIYVLHYLDKSGHDDAEIRSRALSYMKDGYQRQLFYLRDDHSFSAFGNSDPSGSTWLTAFVLRCFLQAQAYMQIKQSVLTGAVTWLLERQGPRGEFNETGRVIHTEMHAGLDKDSVTLTASVLMALMEDQSYVEMHRGNVSLAQRYLEDKVSGGGLSNYTLSLVAYALALANSPVATDAVSELSSRADHRDGVMSWSSSAGGGPHGGQVRSVQIEMASYVLLVLFRHGRLEEGITLMKWLSEQRNRFGGFGTTQDTVVALQALAYYSAFSGSNAINLRLNIQATTSSFVSQFLINSNTYRTYQSQEIDAEKDVNLNIYMEGRGFAMFQMNIFYSVDGKAFSQSSQQARDKEAFSLRVEVTEGGDVSHLHLSICTRLKDSQVVPRTGMAILDVGMLSGFSGLSPDAAVNSDLIRKVDVLPNKVILYLDSVTKSEVCIGFALFTTYKVAHVQDAVVRVYDYYEPTRNATRTYNSDVLRRMTSCHFCGADCERCRPGITVTVSSSPPLAHTVIGATCCLICMFHAVAAFFFAV